jgi:hypothetical protein
MKSKKLSVDEVRKACEELAEMGLVEEGRRNGQIVWRLTPAGKLLADLPENGRKH